MNRDVILILIVLAIFVLQCNTSEKLSAVESRWVNQGSLADSLHGVRYSVSDSDSYQSQLHLQELRDTLNPTLTALSDIANTTRVGKKLGRGDIVDERSKHMVLRQQGIRAPTHDVSERGAHERINTVGRQTRESYAYGNNVLETGFPTAIDGHLGALAGRSTSTRV